MKMIASKSAALFGAVALGVVGMGSAVRAQPPLGTVEMKLAFDAVQFVNSISEDPVVIGTLECSDPVDDVRVSVEVTQDRGSDDAYADGSRSVDCDGVARWMIVTRYGEFDKGRVAVQGTAYYDSNGDGDPEGEAERSDTSDLIACTRIGSLADDRLKGKDGRDRICGLDGDDIMIGRGLGDVLRGGPGDDVLKGNAERDILLGGLGSDLIKGGAGNDTLSGDEGNDSLYGGPGKDKCVGGPGPDRQRGC